MKLNEKILRAIRGMGNEKEVVRKSQPKMEVYAITENGRLLALSTSLAAAGTLQGKFPQTDLLVVEIDDTVWNNLEKETEITIKRLR